MSTSVTVDGLPRTESISSVAARSAAPNPIRILIAEDQQFVADALQAFLSRQPGMLVVDSVDSAADCLPKVVALHPHVVIFEFRLSDDGAAVVTTIQERSAARVIFLTHELTERVIYAAIEAGASAVLNMFTSASEVVHAVRTVAEGGTLINPATIALALNGRGKMHGSHDRLTIRERQVVRLISEGTSNREIAAKLGISYTTVRSHLRHVASKLAAHSKLEVLVKAQRLELVERPTTRYSLA